MIARNGIRSTLRARGRTALFTLLILALTLALALGLGMWSYSSRMLARCDETFTSVAIVEYMGQAYPDANAADEDARQAAAALAEQNISGLDGVTLWEPCDRALAVIEGYKRPAGREIPYEDYGVLECFHFSPAYETEWGSLTPEEFEEEYILLDFGNWRCDVITQGIHAEGVLLCEHDGERVYQETWNEEQPIREFSEEELPALYVCCNPLTGKLYMVGADGVRDLSGFPQYRYYAGSGMYMGNRKVVSGYNAITNRTLYALGRKDSFMLRVEAEDTGFRPEWGEKYLLHGKFVESNSGNAVFAVMDFYEGCQTPPYQQVTDGGEISPLFQQYADFYQTANNYVSVEASDDIAALEAFQQGLLKLDEGRFPAAGEAGVCVARRELADQLGLCVGDSLSMTLLRCGAENRFAMETTEDVRTLTVVGITTAANDCEGDLWVSAAEGGFPDALYGYQLGRAVLDNAKGRQAADALQALAPDKVVVTLYDQGYSAAARPLEAMRTAALAVTLAAVCSALAVLFLFGYLFVGRQRETVAVLVSLGTPAGKIRLWLLSGCAVVAGTAALAGAVLGRLALGQVLQAAAGLAGQMYSAGRQYSEASIGLTRKLEQTTALPLWPAPAAGLAVFGTALLLCLLFLGMAGRQSTPKRGKLRVRVPRGGTSVAGGGPLRFAWLSARRGGWRSGVVPAAALAMVLLLGVLAGNAQSWNRQLEELYGDTAISGRAVSINGRKYTDLTVPAESVRRLWQSGLLESISVSKGWHYWMETPNFGSGGFAEEQRAAWINAQPKLVALNRLDAAAEFYHGQAPEICWLGGWDESFLSGDDYYPFTDSTEFFSSSGQKLGGSPRLVYPAVAGEEFLAAQGLALGDEFSVEISFELLGRVSSEEIRLKAVGSFRQAGAGANLYVPLSFWCGSDWIFGEGEMAGGDRADVELGSAEYMEHYRFSTTNFETCRFTLRSAAQLEEFRGYLAREQFSAVGEVNKNRTTVLLRDQAFTETADSLNRYIAFGRVLFPVLFGLVCVLGFIVSWLMINGRRMEFAMMRGLGAGRGRVFLSFFLEQGLLCLAGAAAGGILLTATGAGAAGWLATAGFLGCYLAGCALSVAAVGRTNLMNLLSERE